MIQLKSTYTVGNGCIYIYIELFPYTGSQCKKKMDSVCPYVNLSVYLDLFHVCVMPSVQLSTCTTDLHCYTCIIIYYTR